MTYTHNTYAEQVFGNKWWFDLDQIAEDHEWTGVGMGECIPETDSMASVLDRSNWEVITTEATAKFGCGWSWDIIRTGSGGAWCDRIVWDAGNDEVSAYFEKWNSALSDYPVADDMHYSECEHDELVSNIEDLYWSDVRDDVPDGWADTVAHHLHECGAETHPEYMQWDTVAEAIRELGYHAADDDADAEVPA